VSFWKYSQCTSKFFSVKLAETLLKQKRSPSFLICSPNEKKIVKQINKTRVTLIAPECSFVKFYWVQRVTFVDHQTRGNQMKGHSGLWFGFLGAPPILNDNRSLKRAHKIVKSGQTLPVAPAVLCWTKNRIIKDGSSFKTRHQGPVHSKRPPLKTRIFWRVIPCGSH